MAKVATIVVNLPEGWNDIKLPPQAKAILASLENKEYSVAEMSKHIKALAESGDLVTGQRPWRIFQYYRAKFIENGFIKLLA